MKTLTNSSINHEYTTDRLFKFFVTYRMGDVTSTRCLSVTLEEFKEEWFHIIRSHCEVRLASVELGDNLYHFTSFSELIKRIEYFDNLVVPEIG